MRTKENLQAKFEAVSTNQAEFMATKVTGDLGGPIQRTRASVAYPNIFGSESTEVATASAQQMAVEVTVALESTITRTVILPPVQQAPESTVEQPV